MRAHQVYYIVQHFFKSCSLQLVKARARKAAKEGGSSRPVVAKSNLRAWTLLTNYFLLLSFFVLTVFTVLCEARIVINIRALKEHFQTGKTSRGCVSGLLGHNNIFCPSAEFPEHFQHPPNHSSLLFSIHQVEERGKTGWEPFFAVDMSVLCMAKLQSSEKISPWLQDGYLYSRKL